MSRKNELSTSIAAYIDHTLLKPNATEQDMLSIAREVKDYGFASACVPSAFLTALKERFPKITLCTVLSFPLGHSSTEIKHLES